MDSDIYVIEFKKYFKKVNSRRQINTNPSYSINYITSQDTIKSLGNHLQNAPSHCISFLEFACPYLFNPNWFMAVEKSLIRLHNSPIIFSDSNELFGYISALSNVLELRVDFNEPYFKKFYSLYYAYLKVFFSIPYPYNRYISTVYKSFSQNQFLFEMFMHPAAYFRLINKEIFYIDPFNDSKLCINTINMLLWHYNSPKKVASILKIIPKVLDDSCIATSIPCCKSNFSFNFKAYGKRYYAYFENENIKCELDENPYMNAMISIDLDVFTEIYFRENTFDFLCNITGGIKQNLDNLAILCALVMTNYYKNIRYTLPSKNCSPLSLFIVYATETQAKFIQWCLDTILLLNQDFESIWQLKDIAKTKNILNLIGQNCLYPTYIPVKPSKSKESEVQIAKIKNIIQRKEIKVQDRYGITHSLLNHLPVICFVDNPKHLSWLQANFKTKTFTFSPFSCDMEVTLTEDFTLLQAFLSIYGLKLLYDTNFKYSSIRNQNGQSENITEAFIKDCLKLDKNHTYYADSLYQFYVNYYHAFYTGAPLTKICFTKEMRKLLPTCPYKKPRHSRSDNRYAFIGINVDQEKALKAFERSSLAYKDKNFTAYLDNAVGNVNNILHTLHDIAYKNRYR